MQPVAANKPTGSVAALLAQATRHLSHLPNGRLDAEYLLAHATNQSRTWLHTWPEKVVDAADAALFEDLVRHRAIGMPVAYLTGVREFWSMPLQVTEDTLIPRPETEFLVDVALQHAPDADLIVDLGTGSGAIALAIATEIAGKTIIGTDLSRHALGVARKNARKLNLRVQFIQSDWLQAFAQECADLIIANPPYVASGDPHLTGDGVVFEPELALLGGPDGLDAYRQIVPQAARHLRQSGTLLVEHGYDQGAAVRQFLFEAGFDRVETHQDDAGLDRVTSGQLVPQPQ